MTILENHRKRGLGKSLVKHIVNDKAFKDIRLDEVEANRARITRETLREQAKGFVYFPGVESWFDRIIMQF